MIRMLGTKKGTFCFILFSLLVSVELRGQTAETIYQTDDYHILPADVGSLSLKIDNLNFFQDNEFSGSLTSGYTLPGLWLQPKLRFQPFNNVRLEMGVHALTYHGASRYPNYAYQDIALWKGEQFQKGFHMLPYFRAQVQWKRLNLVLGNLYGGSMHGLMEPMYNLELNLTADPEMGIQLLYDLPRFHLDTWINWESFIFRQDVHREAFTMGVSSKICYNRPESTVHIYSPLQVMVQHRGGQIDTIESQSVNTLVNAAAGVGMDWNTGRPILQRVNVEADLMGFKQSYEEIYPVKQGYALYAQAGMDFGKHLFTRLGYYWGDDFISLFGSPYFGTVATRYRGATFGETQTLFASADYVYELHRMCAVGAQCRLYYSFPCSLTFPGGGVRECSGKVNVSLGVFLRMNLDFLLKRF